MTPQEKAIELYSKYHDPLLKYKNGLNIKEVTKMQKCAKECALIAVDEILLREKDILTRQNGSWGKFEWQQVKEEILAYGGNK